MELNLTVPPISNRVIGEVEMRPAKVETWLGELPLLNLTETGRRVLSQVGVYNRMEIEPQLRLQLLELFRYTINQISNELEKHYLGLPLPLPDKNKTIAEQNRQIHSEMAFGYKWAVLGLRKTAESNSKDKAKLDQQLAMAVQRAIHYLTETLVISYESYSPYPIGVWREIHTLYQYAERAGLVDLDLEDRCNRVLKRSTVANAYKQALLLDLADPYHLPARHVDKIHLYLERWAGLARVQSAAQAFEPTCQFLIDLNAEQAGIAYTAETRLDRIENYRLLNTVELARMVHAQLTELQGGRTPDPSGLEPNFFRDGEPLLRRLINAWGMHPKRSFRRNSKIDEEIEVAIGIDTVNYWINGGSKVQVSSTFVGPMPQRTLVGPNEKKKQDLRSNDFEFSRWSVLDESAGGLALGKKGTIKTRVRVGDLLALREPESGDTWAIAAVRWVRSASPSSVELGAQRLAPGAEPILIKTVNEKNQESDFLPALLVADLRALKQPPSLITPCGIYRPERMLYLDNGLRLSRITAGKLIETTSAFERFEFSVRDS